MIRQGVRSRQVCLKVIFVGLVFVVLLVSSSCRTMVMEPVAPQDPRPNIVVILADGMGLSDIGCYGSEIKTPNLDALATNGLRYTQFYTMADGEASRTSLLTGLYPQQATKGAGAMVKGPFNQKCVTIAEVMKAAGYSTYMAGTWEDSSVRSEKDKDDWPLQRGFDRFFDTDPVLGNNAADPNGGGPHPDVVSDHALTYMNEHQSANPFFLLVSCDISPRSLYAQSDDSATYQGMYAEGWDQLRSERYERMKEMGLIESSWRLPDSDPLVPSWADVSDKAGEAAPMEAYAVMVSRMDQRIGRIVEGLRQRGDLENTLILYLQTNGAGVTEDKSNDMARGWARAVNTPFRGYKHEVYEGGIASPLIVHWPQGFEAKGNWRHQPCHLIDIMATCVDVGKATYPETFAGQAITAMEGLSLVPTFNNGLLGHVALFWEYQGKRAIRMDEWKLVSKAQGDPKALDQWELYNMESDRTETRDLCEVLVDQAQTMSQMWMEWANHTGIVEE